MRRFLSLFGSGLLIGGADIVPGISGGTVAFIIGIYEELLSSLASFNAHAFSLLFRLKFKAFFAVAKWKFLLSIILGVATSFLLLASFFTYLLHHELYRIYLYALFFGLVLGSTLFCIKQLTHFNLKTALSFVLGALTAFFLTGATFAPNNEPTFDVPYICTQQALNYDHERGVILNVTQSQIAGMVAKKYVSRESEIYSRELQHNVVVADVVGTKEVAIVDVWVIACGMLAISAMLLPGISGSYLLTILGMYGPILGSLVDFFSALKLGTFDASAFRTLGSMLLGIVIGASLFSHVVRYLLHHFRAATLACLIGFMVGALRAVWPFWSYCYALDPLRLHTGVQLQVVDPILPAVFSSTFAMACLFLVVGFCSVLLVEMVASRTKDQKDLKGITTFI